MQIIFKTRRYQQGEQAVAQLMEAKKDDPLMQIASTTSITDSASKTFSEVLWGRLMASLGDHVSRVAGSEPDFVDILGQHKVWETAEFQIFPNLAGEEGEELRQRNKAWVIWEPKTQSLDDAVNGAFEIQSADGGLQRTVCFGPRMIRVMIPPRQDELEIAVTTHFELKVGRFNLEEPNMYMPMRFRENYVLVFVAIMTDQSETRPSIVITHNWIEPWDNWNPVPVIRPRQTGVLLFAAFDKADRDMMRQAMRPIGNRNTPVGDMWKDLMSPVSERPSRLAVVAKKSRPTEPSAELRTASNVPLQPTMNPNVAATEPRRLEINQQAERQTQTGSNTRRLLTMERAAATEQRRHDIHPRSMDQEQASSSAHQMPMSTGPPPNAPTGPKAERVRKEHWPHPQSNKKRRRNHDEGQ